MAESKVNSFLSSIIQDAFDLGGTLVSSSCGEFWAVGLIRVSDHHFEVISRGFASGTSTVKSIRFTSEQSAKAGFHQIVKRGSCS